MLDFYKKSQLGFSLVWIGIYCMAQSIANGISHKIGVYKSANAVLALIQSVVMLCWLKKNGLLKSFRLNKPSQSAGNMLYYVPLILISTSNLWMGVKRNLSPLALGIHILLMLSVGFLEELLFRGFLFEALRKDNLKTAILISSLTFGAGHIVNLFNGSGKNFPEVLFQIVFAVLIGFLFAMVSLRSGSLIPCILSHGTINILSAFTNLQASPQKHLTVNLIEMAVALLYLLIIRKTAPLQWTEAEGNSSS